MIDVVNEIFVYCTDFVINVANLLGISYYEVNAIIFCVLYPLILSISLWCFLRNWIVLRKLKRNSFCNRRIL